MPVPVIDLAAGPAAVLAGRIDAALCASGFFAITGHGVLAPQRAALFDASQRFFALPQASKERWHIDGWRVGAPRRPSTVAAPHGGEQPLGRPGGLLRRGFDPIGWQALDPAQAPDLKESFYLGEEFLGPNQWPDEALVPGFKVASEAWSTAMLALATRLMRLFELALALPRGHFEPFMRHPTCTTRLLHYPPQPAQAVPGQIGCGAHTDWGALTLLAQDDAGGLQVQAADGSWAGVAPLADALVVNVGDLMQRWTNDRWRSALHRVLTPAAGRERWSVAYFFDLDADAVIEPLPGCVTAENPTRHGPITAGQHLEDMYRRTTVSA